MRDRFSGATITAAVAAVVAGAGILAPITRTHAQAPARATPPR